MLQNQKNSINRLKICNDNNMSVGNKNQFDLDIDFRDYTTNLPSLMVERQNQTHDPTENSTGDAGSIPTEVDIVESHITNGQ